MLDDFYEKLTDKLKAYRKTSDYKDKLQKEIEGKIKSLGLNEDEIIVAVVDEDLNLIDFKHTESIEKQISEALCLLISIRNLDITLLIGKKLEKISMNLVKTIPSS